MKKYVIDASVVLTAIVGKKEKTAVYFKKILVAVSWVQIKGVLELAYDLGTTVYDASYHYLARFLDAVFLTCDKEYYEKAKNIGNIELID